MLRDAPCGNVNLFGQREEERPSRAFDFARDVAAAGGVVGEQDLARAELALFARAALNLHAARERDYELAGGRVVEIERGPERRFTKGDALKGDELGDAPVGAFAQGDIEVFEVRFVVGAGVNACDVHAP